MSKVSLSSQSRNFHLVLYPDSATYLTTWVLWDGVVNLKYCSKYAFCLHDKDEDEEGNLKKAHYHLVLSCKYPVKYSDLLNHLELPSNCVTLPDSKHSPRSYRDMVRYLIHADSPKKYQYEIDNITANFDLSTFFDADSQDKAGSAFVDLLDFMSVKTHTRRDIALFAVQSGLIGYYRQYYRILWDIVDQEDFSSWRSALNVLDGIDINTESCYNRKEGGD